MAANNPVILDYPKPLNCFRLNNDTGKFHCLGCPDSVLEASCQVLYAHLHDEQHHQNDTMTEALKSQVLEYVGGQELLESVKHLQSINGRADRMDALWVANEVLQQDLDIALRRQVDVNKRGDKLVRAFNTKFGKRGKILSSATADCTSGNSDGTLSPISGPSHGARLYEMVGSSISMSSSTGSSSRNCSGHGVASLSQNPRVGIETRFPIDERSRLQKESVVNTHEGHSDSVVYKVAGTASSETRDCMLSKSLRDERTTSDMARGYYEPCSDSNPKNVGS